MKIQQMKLWAELAQKKMDNEFQLQMAWMGHEAGSSSTVHNNTVQAPPGGSGYYSNAGSVTPSTYSSELPQLQIDLTLEFFGQNSGYDFNPGQHSHN